MNIDWKRYVRAGAEVVAVIIITVMCTKSCSNEDKVKDAERARKELENANKLIDCMGRENVALHDSVAMWRDSTEFYKKGLDECRNAKKRPAAVKPAARPAKQKSKTVQSPAPVAPKPVEATTVINNTKVNVKDDAKNNNNIVVQNVVPNGNDTEITLGAGATNEGNIVVNNGGWCRIMCLCYPYVSGCCKRRTNFEICFR